MAEYLDSVIISLCWSVARRNLAWPSSAQPGKLEVAQPIQNPEYHPPPSPSRKSALKTSRMSNFLSELHFSCNITPLCLVHPVENY